MGEVIDGKTIEDMNDPALEDEMRTARVMDMMNNIDVSDDEIDAPSAPAPRTQEDDDDIDEDALFNQFLMENKN